MKTLDEKIETAMSEIILPIERYRELILYEEMINQIKAGFLPPEMVKNVETLAERELDMIADAMARHG